MSGSLSQSSLAYAKLAATPTDTAWSQVYNAGNLFACLSLTLTNPSEEPASLQTLGKELLNTLEAEFFTLEEKNIDTVKEAIHKSTKHIPENVTISFCLAFFKDTVLYLFILGQGRAIMKRGDQLGILLERSDDKGESLQTASGYLQNDDTLILETNQFAHNVKDRHVSEALQLQLPNDIAEALSLHMHEQTDGDQAAIIIVYHGITQPAFATQSEAPLEEDDEDLPVTLPPENKPTHAPFPQEPPSYATGPERPSLFTKVSALFSGIRLPFPQHNRRIVMHGLTHRKKIFLSIVCVLLVLLVASIFFTKQNQEATKTSALFASVYDPALKKYDEGKGLASINEVLSREDFLEAQKLLSENKDKFPKGSKEAQQIEELLAKLEAEIGSETTTDTTPVKEITADETSLLAVEKANNSGKGFSQNENNVFFVTNVAAFSVAKSGGKKTELFKNDDAWEQAVSIFPYQTNLYILDQKDGVLKFVPSGSSYSSSAYLKSTQDLSKAVSMAIDSSVWILFSDGTIKKFTRGEADSFSIKDLAKPFKSPTKIYTDPDINNLYILDNGNSRIVKLSVDGSFQQEYVAGVIRQAKDFEVLEKDNKVLILSGDKVWEMNL